MTKNFLFDRSSLDAQKKPKRLTRVSKKEFGSLIKSRLRSNKMI